MSPQAFARLAETPAHRAPLRLSVERLDCIADGVQRPAFNPASLRPGILHLGCGSFHRAHQAFLTQRAIEAEHRAGHGGDGSTADGWGIVAASLVTPHAVRALAEQDGLYTVLERGPDETHASVIGVICGTIYGPDDPTLLQQVFADPAIRIVTATITGAGFCADVATGRLDARLPVVQDDLRRRRPRTAIGILVDGLQQRRARGAAPPVVISCDNLPANGRVLRQVCIDFAALQDDRLADWIARHVQFPGTMVDRIVTAATSRDLERAASALGLVDAMPVCAEPFYQWVIEQFEGPRPRWDAAGAEYVADVTAWEASKLRLLNGGHLAMACLGRLAGCATVADAMEVPGFNAFALRFMLE
jgi:fructuronate reductase